MGRLHGRLLAGDEVNRGGKIRAGLANRVRSWNQLVAVGTHGANTKLVRRDNKGHAAFHKPGSQSGRKGYGKRKVVTKK
jgi:hypothetical protein